MKWLKQLRSSIIVLIFIVIFMLGCGVKMKHLPFLASPYVSEIEFLREVKKVNGKAKKKFFKDNLITSPFYFYIKIKEIENSGIVKIIFYEKQDKNWIQRIEQKIKYGQQGKYFEYIIFFDRVSGLLPGKYRYIIFINQHVIYENQIDIQKIN